MKRVKVGLSVFFAVYMLYGTTASALLANDSKNQIIITKIVRDSQSEIRSVSLSELVLDIGNCTYQPAGRNSKFVITKDVVIAADNITFENSVIHGDLYIKANNTVLRNITVNGAIYIRPLQDKGLKLKSVNFEKILTIMEPEDRSGTEDRSSSGKAGAEDGYTPSGMNAGRDSGKTGRGGQTQAGAANNGNAAGRNGDTGTDKESGNGIDMGNSDSAGNSGGSVNMTENKAVTAYLEQAMIDDYDSVLVVVNKNRSLPETWKPKDLVRLSVPYTGRSEARYMRKEAAEALARLFAGAEKDGITLRAVSGFRSYELQDIVFNKHENLLGTKAAERVSARPGLSEHQTGLAIDISSKSMNYTLSKSFGNTREGIWLAGNAAEFGFILRYPKGKEQITGYDYEPWHFRYVGRDIAIDIMKKGLTLEEYFGLTDTTE